MKSGVLLLLILLTGPVYAGSQGLFDQPQTFPWSVGLSPIVQEESGGLDPQGFRVKASVLWFNTYRQYGLGKEMTQQIDMEGLLETLSGAWSPAPGWEIRGQVQGWVVGGGVMDVLLSGFHGALFLPNQGRNLVPDGQYRSYLKGSFDLSDPRSGITQASGGLRYFAGPWSWTTWVKVPVPAARDWGWSDSWSGGLALGVGDRWRWFDTGIVVGAGAFGGALAVSPDPLFSVAGGATVQAGFYTTAAFSGGTRALVQGSWTKMPRSGKSYLGFDAGLLTSGFQVPLTPVWTLELAMTEEFLTWATMEVGFQLGLTWHPAGS